MVLGKNPIRIPHKGSLFWSGQEPGAARSRTGGQDLAPAPRQQSPARRFHRTQGQSL